MNPNRNGWLASVVFATLAGGASAQIQVIASESPTEASGLVPGAKDSAGAPTIARWRSLSDLYGSPDGSHWLLGGLTTITVGSFSSGLVGGAGNTIDSSLTTNAGAPFPGGAAGETLEFTGTGASFDSSNNFVVTLRSRLGTTTNQRVVRHDAGGWSIVLRQGDLLTGLSDTTVSGDEVFGNSVSGPSLLNDGRVGVHDTTIGNISSLRRPAIFYNTAAFHQINVTSVTTLDGSGTAIWNNLTNAFINRPDGTDWYVTGRLTSTSGPTVGVRNGRVILQSGQPAVAGGPIVNGIFHARYGGDGSLLVRGDDPAAGDWFWRDGVILAKTGDPIVTGSTELWGVTIAGITADAAGHWAAVGTTNNADTGRDTVLVYNGTTVLAREGDPVDFNGNGDPSDDGVQIGRANPALSAFGVDDLFIGNDGYVYFLAELKTSDGLDLPSAGTAPHDALLRVAIPSACPCVADFDGSGGTPDTGDIDAFFMAWLAGDATADADCSGGTPDINDIDAFFVQWLAGGC